MNSKNSAFGFPFEFVVISPLALLPSTVSPVGLDRSSFFFKFFGADDRLKLPLHGLDDVAHVVITDSLVQITARTAPSALSKICVCKHQLFPPR